MGGLEQAEATNLIADVPRTSLQLYSILVSQNRSTEDLAQVRLAYDYAVDLYSGSFQADGKPFLAHVIGVGGVAALLELPTEMVTAGILHNIYGTGNFGDGLVKGRTEERVREVVARVGPELEATISQLASMRLEKHLDRVAQAQLSELETLLITVDLGDALEKCLDQGVLYMGDGQWAIDFLVENRRALCDLARDVGQPVLAEALDQAISDVETADIPEVLRNSPNRRYVHTIAPRSHALRTGLRLRQQTRRPVVRKVVRRARKATSKFGRISARSDR